MVIFKYFKANDILVIFLKDSLELHSLKAGNLEVLQYFCCVQKIRKDFVSFYLHGGLIRVC